MLIGELQCVVGGSLRRRLLHRRQRLDLHSLQVQYVRIMEQRSLPTPIHRTGTPSCCSMKVM